MNSAPYEDARGDARDDAGDDCSVARFYGRLAADYHLIHDDWDGAAERQGRALDAVIRSAVRCSRREGAPHGERERRAAAGVVGLRFVLARGVHDAGR